jgi:hypothetical protein
MCIDAVEYLACRTTGPKEGPDCARPATLTHSLSLAVLSDRIPALIAALC